MGDIHLEDVVGRGQHHLRPFGQHHRLKHVGNPGDVGHLDAVGERMERIEAQSSHHGVAKRVLLIEVSGNRTGLLVKPCAPFVNEQATRFWGHTCP